MSTYFCDGIRDITILNGVVRLEFHRLEAAEPGQSRDVRAVPDVSVALPVQGFLLAVAALDKARDQLEANETQKADAPLDGGSPPPPPPRGKSPNFM